MHQARRSLLAPWPVRAVWTMQWCLVATWDPWAVKGHMNCTSSLNGRKAPGGVGTTGEQCGFPCILVDFLRREIGKDVTFCWTLKWWNRPEKSGLKSMLHFRVHLVVYWYFNFNTCFLRRFGTFQASIMCPKCLLESFVDVKRSRTQGSGRFFFKYLIQ